jgi:hypothetical protein
MPPHPFPAALRNTAPDAPAVTPIAFVQAIVLAYERRGMDPACAGVGTNRAGWLLSTTSRITAWQMERISGLARCRNSTTRRYWFNWRLPQAPALLAGVA